MGLKNFLHVLDTLIEWFKGSSFGMTPLVQYLLSQMIPRDHSLSWTYTKHGPGSMDHPMDPVMDHPMDHPHESVFLFIP